MAGADIYLSFPSDHPALAGHFPRRPIIPGVMLLDAALHAIERAAPAAQPGGCWHIASAKFHRPVRPDEKLRLEYAEQSDGRLRVELRSATTLVLSAALERRRP